MMSSMNRRQLLAALAAASAAGSLPLRGKSPDAGAGAIRLGVASYSLRKFDRAAAIKIIQALKTPYVNIKEFHLRYASTPAELKAGREEFARAGLQIVGGGTISLKKDEDEDVRQYFEYAKACGMPMMVVAPTPEVMPRVEKFVKAYNIKVAVHNHGPEDPYFPAPQDAIKVVKNMDPRVGLCIDVGHTARTGVDVVTSIAEAGSRLLDMHMKDLRDLSDKDSQCIVGEGKMPVPEIFGQLIKMGYGGLVQLEYEIDADDPLPGMQQSFAYMRGVLAGMKAS